MRMHRSMAEVFRDPGVTVPLLDMLFEMPALEPWAELREQMRKALLFEPERRWSESDKFSPNQVAKAAGVRVSLIRKYIREGVRGTGRLFTDEEGNVTLYDLVHFASLHGGRARDVALKALGQLARAGPPTAPATVPGCHENLAAG